jgi:hypothetical protein
LEHRALLASVTGAASDNGSWEGPERGSANQVAADVSSSLVISELRTRGPAGARDEYIELYNPAATPLTISTTDASSGWSVVASDGIIRFIVPNGTVIPARGHYLGVNLGAGPYSLSTYAAADASYTLNIPDNGAGEGGVNRGVALFRTSTPANFITANRLDAVGPAGETNALYREGGGYANLNPAVAATAQFALVRNAVGGQLQDTDSNAADFRLVDTTGNVALASGNRWGAPGPENRTGPVQINGQLGVTLFDPGAPATAAPNRQRDLANGTLTIRRRFTNNTGGPITLLRFRVADLTNDLASSTACVLRAVTSSDVTVPTSAGNVLARGTALETPPNQTNGGGLNSSLRVMAITVVAPLAAGASVDLQFVFNVVENGDLNVVLNAEVLFTGAAVPGPGTAAPFSDAAIAPVAVAPDLDAASDTGPSSTDDLTSDNTPTLTGITSSSGVVQLFDGTTLLGSTTADGFGNWSINVGAPLDEGAHALRTAVTANNVTSRLSPALNVTIDNAPTADVLDVSPDPRTTGVSSINIVFSEAVSGFNQADLSLTRNGGTNLLTGPQTLTTSDNITYTLNNLTDITSLNGSYALTLTAAGSGITDTAGNALSSDVSDTWTHSLPAWLAPASVATWDSSTRTLSVTGAATLTGDPGAGNANVKVVGGSAMLTVAPVSSLKVALASLDVSGGAKVLLQSLGASRTEANHRVLMVAALSIDAMGRLDLADNDLIVDYSGASVIGAVESLVGCGFSVGDWLGAGITSSVAAAPSSNGNYALGVAENALLTNPFGNGTSGPMFAGQAVDNTTVLVKFIHRVDLDLDGLVSGNDAAIFNGAFSDGDSGATWMSGDVDFDGMYSSNDAAIFNSFYDESLGAI